MKHVYGTDEIAHLWAHKTQAEARNQQSNFYFDGDTIYSYGSHFPIARHVVNARGEAGILFTTRGYSSTTAKHISLVRRAIHGNNVSVLLVEEIRSSTPRTLEIFQERITATEKRCFGSTGRFKPTVWCELEVLIEQANAYASFFGSRKRWTLPENQEGIKAQIAKDNARRAKLERKAAKAREEYQRERAAKALESLAAWRTGAHVDSYLLYDLPFTALRIDGDEVETTRGARFPVEHARKGVAFVRAIVARGEDWARNGHTFRLGNYAIDRVEADGTVHAGCHVVGFGEVELIAGELGL